MSPVDGGNLGWIPVQIKPSTRVRQRRSVHPPGQACDRPGRLNRNRITMIIYLHGFRSSPASEKARLLSDHLNRRGLGDRFWCEALPVSPRLAIESIERTIRSAASPPVLIGSSLGGYYATYLAERHDLRAMLINPATDAARILAPWVGRQTNLYSGEVFDFTQAHIEELAALWVPVLAKPERFWLVVETGDELLDYREALSRYAGARQTLYEGGDHSLRHFPELLDAIVEFAWPEWASPDRSMANQH